MTEKRSFTSYVRGYQFDHWEDNEGRQVVTCRRDDSGICGYGKDDREALQDYEDKQQELLPLPLPKASRVIFSSPFEPPEYSERERPREEE